MRDKERLRSPDEPLRFIFSHSALREGWDNPNVFQICTRNETVSEIKKRQEIERGMRLPVLASGEHCTDESLNRLTIVANERHEEFARQLQTEIEEETGASFAGRVHDRRDRRTAGLKDGWKDDPHFRLLWERISQRTRCRVAIPTEQLIEEAAAAVKSLARVEAPTLVAAKGALTIDSEAASTSPPSTSTTTW
jgi:type III restriction enzyme